MGDPAQLREGRYHRAEAPQGRELEGPSSQRSDGWAKMNQINTSQVKKIAQNLDEPVRVMIYSLPDEIECKALVEKFDLILPFLSKKKEGLK